MMITKQNTYSLLIFLTLVSFGFFGSLSHIFCFALIILGSGIYIRSDKKNTIDGKAKTLFLALSGCFFLFFIGSVFRNNFGAILHWLSPMLPIPFIGLLIILHDSANFKLKSKQVSHFSQISVIFSFFIYLLISLLPDPSMYYYKFHGDRLMLFSGNPIPFSFAMLGVSLFCLADWRNSGTKSKLTAFSCFLLGAYFSGILSGTRATLLSIIMITPIIIYYLSNHKVFTLLTTSVLILIGLLLLYLGTINNYENELFNYIKNGLVTLAFKENIESSVWQRLEMWTASLRAISEAPLYGYGVTERFNALKPFLHGSVPFYSHPHNDIFASIISIGFIGGLAAVASLMSCFIASLLTPNWSFEKVYISSILSISVIVISSVSTVFFNDICAAWLAFSTYLIWATDFKGTDVNLKKEKPSTFFKK